MMAYSGSGIHHNGPILDNNSVAMQSSPADQEQLVSLLKKNGNKRRVRGGKSTNDGQVELHKESRGALSAKCRDQVITGRAGAKSKQSSADDGTLTKEEKAPLQDTDCQRNTNNVNTTTSSSKQPTQTQIQKKAQKPRRRVATLAQRRAANIRERRRMFNLNAAFDRLRKKVPSFAYEKRLSRIETLKLAIMYIKFMDDLVKDDEYAEKYKQLTSNTNHLSSAASSVATSSFLSSGTYLSLYGHHYGMINNNNNGHNDTDPSPGLSIPVLEMNNLTNNHQLQSDSIMGQTQPGAESSSYPKHSNHCNTIDLNPIRGVENIDDHVTDCQMPLSSHQYCKDTQCSLDYQLQHQQQQQQHYRALPTTSPVSGCGSSTYCFSPNSSSTTTTCQSFPSSTNISNGQSSSSTSPNSSIAAPASSLVQQPLVNLNPMTPTSDNVPLYYSNQQHQQNPQQAYEQHQQKQHQQPVSTPTLSITRSLYAGSDSCNRSQQEINAPNIYYDDNPHIIDMNTLRKPLESCNHHHGQMPSNLSSSQHTQIQLSNQSHHLEQVQLTNSQHHYNRIDQNPEHIEHHQQSIYSLHSLEAI